MEEPEKSRTFIVIGEAGIGLAESRALAATHEKIIAEMEKTVIDTVGDLAEAMKEDISRFVLPTPPKKPKSKYKGWQRPYKYHR